MQGTLKGKKIAILATNSAAWNSARLTVP